MSKHTPVLLQESIDSLNLKAGDTFLDGTVGSGGHSALVAERFGDSVTIIGLDRDSEALKRSEARLQPLTSNFRLFQESFRNIDKVLEKINVDSLSAILLDIGISSDQLEISGKGFSFQNDEPLDMRMGEEGISAADVLNEFEEETLELIIRGFGEERYSRKIAREIVERRKVRPFKSTFDLVEAVKSATPASSHRGRIHPATRTFQAIRIAVNEELTALEEGMEKGFKSLNSEGRMVVITFHSLEDRLVKNYFRDLAKQDFAKLIVKKPIAPTEEETIRNPRSRSAKLRIIEKL